MLFPLVVLFFSGLCLWMAEAQTVSFVGGGPEAIRADLPAGWRQMAPEELRLFEKDGKGLLLRQGSRLTAGYRLNSGNALVDGPLILVLEGQTEKPIQQEHIQKIYSWFEKHWELVTETFPAAVDRMSIQDIEYFQDKETILFQSAIEMAGNDFTCISSIIFMRDGFAVLVGLARKDADGHKEDISAFMRNVQVPEHRRLQQQYGKYAVMQWLSVNWQQALGFTLLLAVFAVALRRRREGKGE